MRHYLFYPESPLSDALKVITGKRPPAYCKGIYSTRELSEERMVELQDWCACNVRPEWATGLGAIEAAELLVAGAVENANIPAKGKAR